MWNISKQFDFCYGHRVWNQELNKKFSLDSLCKCRHLHGHQGKVIIYLQGEELQNGMVTDFKHLNWFKKWLDESLDHKMILDINDPSISDLFPFIKSFLNDLKNFLKWKDLIDYKDILSVIKNVDFEDSLKEIYQGLVLVDFIPTSENFSKFFFKIVSQKMKEINVKVSKVEFWETPKSCSTFTI